MTLLRCLSREADRVHISTLIIRLQVESSFHDMVLFALAPSAHRWYHALFERVSQHIDRIQRAHLRLC